MCTPVLCRLRGGAVESSMEEQVNLIIMLLGKLQPLKGGGEGRQVLRVNASINVTTF